MSGGGGESVSLKAASAVEHVGGSNGLWKTKHTPKVPPRVGFLTAKMSISDLGAAHIPSPTYPPLCCDKPAL